MRVRVRRAVVFRLCTELQEAEAGQRSRTGQGKTRQGKEGRGVGSLQDFPSFRQGQGRKNKTLERSYRVAFSRESKPFDRRRADRTGQGKPPLKKKRGVNRGA